MHRAKLFMNGRSQAVRLPKEYRFEGEEVLVKKLGDMLVMVPPDKAWQYFIASLNTFTADFMEERSQPTRTDKRRRV